MKMKPARNRFAAKAGRGFRRKTPIPASSPNIPIDKLRAVSKEMAQLLALPVYKTIEVAMTDKTLKDVDYKMVPATWLEAIAADLLRLAEENEALFKAAYDIYLRYPGFGQGLNEEDEYLSDNLTDVVEKYNRDHRAIPATVGKPKT